MQQQSQEASSATTHNSPNVSFGSLIGFCRDHCSSRPTCSGCPQYKCGATETPSSGGAGSFSWTSSWGSCRWACGSIAAASSGDWNGCRGSQTGTRGRFSAGSPTLRWLLLTAINVGEGSHQSVDRTGARAAVGGTETSVTGRAGASTRGQRRDRQQCRIGARPGGCPGATAAEAARAPAA